MNFHDHLRKCSQLNINIISVHMLIAVRLHCFASLPLTDVHICNAASANLMAESD